jgi:hypothetical protein
MDIKGVAVVTVVVTGVVVVVVVVNELAIECPELAAESATAKSRNVPQVVDMALPKHEHVVLEVLDVLATLVQLAFEVVVGLAVTGVVVIVVLDPVVVGGGGGVVVVGVVVVVVVNELVR